MKQNNVHANQPVSAIILAAGNSVRMGSPKAQLPYGNGKTFAQQVTGNFLAYGCKPVILVVQEGVDFSGLQTENLVAVINRAVERGRSYSIHLGMQALPAGVNCFIHNIDNPFPSTGLLDRMFDALPPDGYTVPVYQGRGGHPILLGSKMIRTLQGQSEPGDFRQAISGFARIEVPWLDGRILWNINTPEEYQRFLLSSGNQDKLV
ncbi:MAG: NTP transferase domain-containing protein [Bacteroidota bacterium]